MPTVDWKSLRHAYGPATDIPTLLAQARIAAPSDDYRVEPWYSLWSSLAHQGDVYSASYAAVPELIGLAAMRSDSAGIEALLLAASIELDRQRPSAPPIPSDIRQEYDHALRTGRSLCGHLRDAGSRPDDPRRVAISLAVFEGDFVRARTLLGEDEARETE
jgi:hypothetical protein